MTKMYIGFLMKEKTFNEREEGGGGRGGGELRYPWFNILLAPPRQ
jgi:hypothetical protein